MTEESVGAQVARRRSQLRLSARQLGDATGVHRVTIGKIEKDDPSVEDFTVQRLLRGLDLLERRYGASNADEVTNLIELPDGTRVTFTGSVENVAEAASRFLASRTHP